MTATQWDLALAHLAHDVALADLFGRFPGEAIQSSGSAFQVLANSIVGQQISVRAAAAIFGRLTTLLGTWQPEGLSGVTDGQLRAAGLSVRKVEYLRGLADSFLTGRLNPKQWEAWDDAAVLNDVVAVRGIGRWTAEMLLIFHLQRPDVLPLDDLGLLQSAARQFGWEYPFDPNRLAERAEAWRPWRTVATWYLWRALDPEPVVY